MSSIIEDGMGKANAESYISVADATAYHAGRGSAAWASLADDTAREILLRKATDFMVAAYRERWAGSRMTAVQALDWAAYEVPMRDVQGGYGTFPVSYPDDEVPAAVARACAELALRAISPATWCLTSPRR